MWKKVHLFHCVGSFHKPSKFRTRGRRKRGENSFLQLLKVNFYLYGLRYLTFYLHFLSNHVRNSHATGRHEDLHRFFRSPYSYLFMLHALKPLCVYLPPSWKHGENEARGEAFLLIRDRWFCLYHTPSHCLKYDRKHHMLTRFVPFPWDKPMSHETALTPSTLPDATMRRHAQNLALEVPPKKCDLHQIKIAYLLQCRKFHPLCGGDSEKYHELKKSYAFIASQLAQDGSTPQDWSPQETATELYYNTHETRRIEEYAFLLFALCIGIVLILGALLTSWIQYKRASGRWKTDHTPYIGTDNRLPWWEDDEAYEKATKRNFLEAWRRSRRVDRQEQTFQEGLRRETLVHNKILPLNHEETLLSPSHDDVQKLRLNALLRNT